MLELTKASQVANAELFVNAELVGPNPIEAAVDRGHDEVGSYSISFAVCLTCIFWLKHISVQVGSGSISQPQHSGGSGQRPSCGCTLA
jgi:hypothetical protein